MSKDSFLKTNFTPQLGGQNSQIAPGGAFSVAKISGRAGVEIDLVRDFLVNGAQVSPEISGKIIQVLGGIEAVAHAQRYFASP
ncbi:MAG: hypothetical protein ACT4OY_05530 [Alphaproteobacteria bacterium]